ncbi:putative T7SS-secreted protein [Kitasatospora indigofera]|uniref:putative T7SS-secreted protein n=1 Tax=Kitasatospora indigofera TaxID=67307 RepID=UPI00367CFD70
MSGFPGPGTAAPRDRAGFAGIGFDPAPGDTAGVEVLAAGLRQAAKEIDDARQIVARVSHNGSDWQGEAADAFSARIGKLPAQLDTAHASFTTACTTLHAWRDQLADLQRRADDDEKQAEAARTKLTTAKNNPDLKLAGQWLPDNLVEDATRRFNAASADLQAATDELDRIIARADDLRHRHDQLAIEAAVAVKRAADQAPNGPGWFAHLMDEVQKVVALHVQLAEDAAAWARDHANAIKAVGDMLSNASSMLGLLSLTLLGATVATAEIPPLAMALGTAAGVLGGMSTALSGGALGVHTVAAAAGADVPATSFAFDVAGAVPVVGTLGKAGQVGAKIIGYSREADAVSGTGSAISGVGWIDDATGIQQFLPRSKRQFAEALAGGFLGIGLENAWKDGSKADQATKDAKDGG